MSFKKLGLLKRRLYLANSETRLHVYDTLNRSALEYAHIIWRIFFSSPYLCFYILRQTILPAKIMHVMYRKFMH